MLPDHILQDRKNVEKKFQNFCLQKVIFNVKLTYFSKNLHEARLEAKPISGGRCGGQSGGQTEGQTDLSEARIFSRRPNWQPWVLPQRQRKKNKKKNTETPYLVKIELGMDQASIKFCTISNDDKHLAV